MTPAALLLILCSAVIHAGWNLACKRDRPSAALFLIANAVGVLVLLPLVAILRLPVSRFPLTVWGLLALTGGFQTLYYCALAGAYRAGDLSLAYPMARALPVLLVPLFAGLLGQGSPLGIGTLFGFALIVAGCLLLPLQRVRDFHWSRYRNRSGLLALLAAGGTAGYTLADARSQAILSHLPSHPFSPLQAALAYMAFEALASCLGMAAVLPFWEGGAANPQRLLASSGKTAVVMGIGIYLGYGLVLIAMNYVTNVAYVAAFRQVSIPIGAALGITLLGEPRPRPKLLGLGLIILGLALTALG